MYIQKVPTGGRYLQKVGTYLQEVGIMYLEKRKK